MIREATFLQQIAERPDDRSLRLVFCDWLLEQGDERGEVIALWARGGLSLTERRRIAKVTSAHAAEWLGPLTALADLQRTHFLGGFLDELVCGVGRSPQLFAALTGEPRLATVRALTVPPHREPLALDAFLAHPVLRRVERLRLGAAEWRALRLFRVEPGGLAPRQVVVGSWGFLQGELAPLSSVKLFQQARAVGLSTTEFMYPRVVEEIERSVFAQHRALEGFEEIKLMAREGVLEGAAAWLLACEGQLSRRAVLERVIRWGVGTGDVSFVRSREPGGSFHHLLIDFSAPEERGWRRLASTSVSPNAEAQVATAAGVLLMLAPARLKSVQVKLPHGARLRSQERHALMAAARRSGALEHFSIIEDAFLP